MSEAKNASENTILQIGDELDFNQLTVYGYYVNCFELFCCNGNTPPFYKRTSNCSEDNKANTIVQIIWWKRANVPLNFTLFEECIRLYYVQI